MMYKCIQCGAIISDDEVKVINTSYESYYDAPIGSFTPLSIKVCPLCESEDLDEFEPYDEDEEEDDE